MRNISNIYKLTAAVLLALALQSCGKRENGIDNNQIITKPYSLYVVDSFGKMWNTNDGNVYYDVFDSDGDPSRALTTSGNNLVWVKRISAVSGEDNGIGGNNHVNFNPINLPAGSIPTWQSMILDVPDHKRVYMAANDGRGIIYSDSNGKRNTWQIDNGFNTDITGSVIITSFAQLVKGDLFAYDHINSRLFQRNGMNALWNQVNTTGLPAGGKFFLSRFVNTLVLGDSTGLNGVWYSTNGGQSWAQYTFPGNVVPKVLCMKDAFQQAFLVGTADKGLFRLAPNSTTFTTANEGLLQGSRIRGISSKDDVYKNDQIVQYVYIATNTGLYRSVDIGRNWIQVKPGNYTVVY